VIEWITRKVDHETRPILNFENKSVSSYQASVFNQIYHFKEAHIKVTLEWLKQKNESTNFLTIMKGWWSEGQFRAKSASVEWNTSKFRKSIQIIVIFLSRVFRRKDGAIFSDKWIPIIYQIISSGSTLNWGELISSNLDLELKKVLGLGIAPFCYPIFLHLLFFMTVYHDQSTLLYHVCPSILYKVCVFMNV
jgi:hypothetical protein